MNKFNLQLYSVRNSLNEDFKGTLKKISDMGYDGVELCGEYEQMSAEELAEYLDFLGLEAVSAHIPLDRLENELEHFAKLLSACGCRYAVCPYADFKTEQEAIALGKRLDELAQRCAMHGLNLCYHNHAHEFEKSESGEYLYDIMMRNAELVLPEFDVYWLVHAGVDVEQKLRDYAGKINLLHLKQMKDAQSKELTSLDNGIIDFAPIIKTAKLLGTEHFIVEQDHPDKSELEDAKASVEFIKTVKA